MAGFAFLFGLTTIAVLVSSACGGAAPSFDVDAGQAEPPRVPDARAPVLPVPDGFAEVDASFEGGSDAAGDAAATAVIACGASTCAKPAWCRICGPTAAPSTLSCETDPAKFCAKGPLLRVACDGREDCLPTERCILYEGSLGTYVNCVPNTDRLSGVVCRTLADCPVGANVCEPYALNHPVRVCK
jgi:hypothetical protein